MSQESPQDFEKRTRELLEQGAARLDGRTQSRLTRARHAALGRLEMPVRLGWRTLVPAGAAAMAVVALMVWRAGTETVPPTAQYASPIEDLEFLTDGEAPDFVDGEELEFYEWAASEMES
jgi:cystathionine beta-lyase/cystathionine gamma-synthase